MQIGARMRRVRRERGLSLQAVADRCGVTRSLLSKIETGASTPPIATLMKIAAALSVPVAALLEDSGTRTTLFTPASAMDADKLTPTEKGYAFCAFAAERVGKAMQPFFFRAKKGGVRPKPLSHQGEEFVYVLRGEMRYRVGAVTHVLKAGDSLYFDAIEDHDLEPLSAVVEFLAIFTMQPEPKKGASQ